MERGGFSTACLRTCIPFPGFNASFRSLRSTLLVTLLVTLQARLALPVSSGAPAAAREAAAGRAFRSNRSPLHLEYGLISSRGSEA